MLVETAATPHTVFTRGPRVQKTADSEWEDIEYGAADHLTLVPAPTAAQYTERRSVKDIFLPNERSAGRSMA